MGSALVDDRKVLLEVANWWENDRNRLRVIKFIFWLMFGGSVSGTLYAWWQGALPAWAISAYVTFAATLVFATFMYAIKHSSDQEKRSFLYTIRKGQLPQWRLEREMLAEFARYCACHTSGVKWSAASEVVPRNVRSKIATALWPTVNVASVLRGDIENIIAHIDTGGATAQVGPPDPGDLQLDLVAYSSETFIALSREIVNCIEGLTKSVSWKGRVRVRVLIRDMADGYDWLVPVTREERRDNEYASELRVRFTNVRKSCLGEFSEGLKEVLAPDRVDFQVRGYRLEPLVKGVLVNRARGVFGLYGIDELRSPVGWDFSGHAVTMCRADSGGEGYDVLAARFFTEWFENVWKDHQVSRAVDEGD